MLPHTTASAIKKSSTGELSLRMWAQYAGLASLVFASTAVSNHALHWVQYPVKVVFKSSKLVPTMLVGTFMGNSKRYAAKEYFAALMICAGVAGFAWGGGKEGGSKDPAMAGQVLVGVWLLIISVIADSFVPNIQQRFLQGPHAITVEELMMRTNIIGCLAVILFMIVSNDMSVAIASCVTNPRLLIYFCTVGCTIGISVRCYTGIVGNSGSVTAVAVATLRKVATVVISYVIFPKPIEATHIVAGLVVILGILLAMKY